MNNIIIVEGPSDKHFLEGYLAYLQATFPKEYVSIDDIRHQRGQDSLTAILKSLSIEINTGAIKNVGILLDANADGVASKIQDKVNPAIEQAFGIHALVRQPNQKYHVQFQQREFQIFCHILNLAGQGELEDILKAIRTWKDAPMPACLDQFVACIGGYNVAYFEKRHKKNFISFYGYDCLKKEGFTDAELKSKFLQEAYYLPEYWDFEHEFLLGIREFIGLFHEALRSPESSLAKLAEAE